MYDDASSSPASPVDGAAAVSAFTGAPPDATLSGDDALRALLGARSIRTTSDVLDLMTRIDAVLVLGAPGDGLKAFNTLYRMVTEGVAAGASWEDRAWILGLDVLFAELYFDGVERCLRAPDTAPDTAPAAWRALMDRRFQPRISAVQFALAGMSAHINRDLPIAVVRTWLALGPADHGRGTPQFRDYLRINGVLDAVEPGAMSFLATGLLERLDDLLAPADGWVAMRVLHAARDVAWTNAEALAHAGLDSDDGRAYVTVLDTVAADAGRVALVAVG